MILSTFLIAVVFTVQAKVTIYPMNQDLARYTGIKVSAGGENIDLYAVKVNLGRTWPGRPGDLNRVDAPVAMFDTDDVVDVVITRENTNSAIVRPSRAGVTASVSNGNTIRFTLPKTGQYSVEFNGSANDALMIFSNPPMDTPTGTILAAGTYGDQTIRSGTLWLMPGAVVRGKVVFEADGARIMGRGIIDGSNSHSWDSGGGSVLPIEDYGHRDLTIDGISVFDSDGWSIQLQKTFGATVHNVKIISSRQNSDGISIQSAQRITITNSFVRSWDDSIVVKNYGSQASAGIDVRDVVVWTDLAQSLEIGVETNAGYDGQPNPVEISDVQYERVDIIHANHKAPISIHNGDNCDVHDISYTDVVVEDAEMGQGDGWNYLVDFTNMNGAEMGGDPGWTHHDGYRQIRNVTVQNVKVLSGKRPGARIGNGGNGNMSNIKISAVSFGGESLNVCELAGNPNGVTCS